MLVVQRAAGVKCFTSLKGKTMGHFRFHRSIGNKFFRLNISKRGMSISGGVPGAHINVPIMGRKRQAMGTLSIPGTGLSYRQRLGSAGGSSGSRRSGIGPGNADIPLNQQILFFFIGFVVIAGIWWWFS